MCTGDIKGKGIWRRKEGETVALPSSPWKTSVHGQKTHQTYHEMYTMSLTTHQTQMWLITRCISCHHVPHTRNSSWDVHYVTTHHRHMQQKEPSQSWCNSLSPCMAHTCKQCLWMITWKLEGTRNRRWKRKACAVKFSMHQACASTSWCSWCLSGGKGLRDAIVTRYYAASQPGNKVCMWKSPDWTLAQHHCPWPTAAQLH